MQNFLSHGKSRTLVSVLCGIMAFWFFSAVLPSTAFADEPATQIRSPGAALTPPFAHPSLMADTTAIVPGKPFRVGVELLMDKGWHTYYKESGEAGMPTKIEWTLPPGFSAAELMWERPHKFSDSGITTYGYADKTVIAATVTPPATIKPGDNIKISAKISWLTCQDVCVPGKKTIDITLPVAADAQPANTEKFSNVNFNGKASEIKDDQHSTASGANSGTGGGNSGGTGKSILDQDFKTTGSGPQEVQGGLAGVFLFAFIGGMILNLMPCVLPVISIKIFGLMQQAGDHPKKVLEHGLVFTAGILTSFLFLGGLVVAIQSAGQKVGWGFQFQYPVFVFAMACIVTVFSLAMFGLFYIAVTAGQSEIDKLASSEGLSGTFFKGVLATTLSTPCSAPFLGTALGFAFTQPWWIILSVFLTIGLGMSSPYILLTARPQWMKYLPKPGTWMETFKESMGFLLLATVVWLIWVLGKQVGIDAAMAAVAFLVVLSFASWLIGRYDNLMATTQRKVTVWSIAAVIVGLGWFVLLRPFPALLSTNPAEARQIHGGETEESGSGIQWKPFTVAELDKEVAAKKTVLVDFTADWCLTCKANEATVINTAPVIDKIKALKVVALKADWTGQDKDITALLAKFGRSGVPLYVIFPANKGNAPIQLPDTITQQIVLDDLDKAGPSQ